MESGLFVLLALALVWFVWGGRESLWRNARAAVDAESRAAAVARLTQKGRALFVRAPAIAPSFEEFVDEMGGDCSAAGMSTAAAYYGFRAMADVGGAGPAGITAERVALLASPA